MVSITPRPLAFGRRFFSGPCPPALLCVLVFIFLLAASISDWTNYSSMQTDEVAPEHVIRPWYAEVAPEHVNRPWPIGKYTFYSMLYHPTVEDDAQLISHALSLFACLGYLFTCLTVCQARSATP